MAVLDIMSLENVFFTQIQITVKPSHTLVPSATNTLEIHASFNLVLINLEEIDHSLSRTRSLLNKHMSVYPVVFTPERLHCMINRMIILSL